MSVVTEVYTIISRSGLKLKTVKPSVTSENTGDQVVIGFRFASDWLRGWREFLRSITDWIYAENQKNVRSLFMSITTNYNQLQL